MLFIFNLISFIFINKQFFVNNFYDEAIVEYVFS